VTLVTAQEAFSTSHYEMESPSRPRQRELARVAASQYGLLTRAQARKLGLTDSLINRRLRSGLYIKAAPKVLGLAGLPPTWEQRLMATCLRRPGRVWVSHRAAAAFWNLDGFSPEIVEVTTDVDLRSYETGTVIHRALAVPPRDVTVVKGIPITTVHRTLIDLGAEVNIDDLELALECALRRGVTTVPRLMRRLDSVAVRGKRGSGAIRAVLEQRGDKSRPTESELETRFLQFLRRHRRPLPERQSSIHDDEGFVARVDFVYPANRLVVEVESRRHHSSRGDWERDLRRRNRLTSANYRVLHATHDRMRTEPDGLACEIGNALGIGFLWGKPHQK
jgi:very-short-patch-repair endonuclease